MKKPDDITASRAPLSLDIPEDLRAYLESVPEVTQEDFACLHAAAKLLDDDPLLPSEHPAP